MATTLRYWKKFTSIIYTQNAFIWYKNCKNRTFSSFIRSRV